MILKFIRHGLRGLRKGQTATLLVIIGLIHIIGTSTKRLPIRSIPEKNEGLIILKFGSG